MPHFRGREAACKTGSKLAIYLKTLGLKDGRGLTRCGFRHGLTDALRNAGHMDAEIGIVMGTANSPGARLASPPDAGGARRADRNASLPRLTALSEGLVGLEGGAAGTFPSDRTIGWRQRRGSEAGGRFLRRFYQPLPPKRRSDRCTDSWRYWIFVAREG